MLAICAQTLGMTFDPAVIRERAEHFSQAVFQQEIRQFVTEQWADFQAEAPAERKHAPGRLAPTAR